MPLPYRAEGDMREGWMTCDEYKFPNGHKEIVNDIKKYGFIPAIWTNANITNQDFPKFHTDAVIMNEDKPMKGEWIEFLYSCTNDTLDNQVTPIFEGFQE